MMIWEPTDNTKRPRHLIEGIKAYMYLQSIIKIKEIDVAHLNKKRFF